MRAMGVSVLCVGSLLGCATQVEDVDVDAGARASSVGVGDYGGIGAGYDYGTEDPLDPWLPEPEPPGTEDPLDPWLPEPEPPGAEDPLDPWFPPGPPPTPMYCACLMEYGDELYGRNDCTTATDEATCTAATCQVRYLNEETGWYEYATRSCGLDPEPFPYPEPPIEGSCYCGIGPGERVGGWDFCGDQDPLTCGDAECEVIDVETGEPRIRNCTSYIEPLPFPPEEEPLPPNMTCDCPVQHLAGDPGFFNDCASATGVYECTNLSCGVVGPDNSYTAYPCTLGELPEPL